MPRLTKETVETLANDSDQVKVSIYLPTEKAGDETQQNSIRFKNRLKQASEDLSELGHKQNEITELLAQARELESDHEFWQNQQNGLAVLISPDRFDVFKLSESVPSLTVVSSQFHLKPLIPYSDGQRHYFVLALAEGGVALFRAGHFGAEPITLQEGPESLSEFLQWDDPETELQWHTQTGRLDVRRTGTGAGMRGSIFHGHGAGAETEVETENLLRFLKALDSAVYDLLAGDRNPPLVLLGSEELIGHYRKVNNYSSLMDEAVFQVPNDLDPQTVHDLTFDKVKDYFDEERQLAYQRFHEVEAGRSTVDLKSTITAAKEGRLELLFLKGSERKWGSYQPQERSIEILEGYQPGAVDLLDLAATETFINGGQVFMVDHDQMPGEGPVAAVLRFEMA